MFHSDLSNSSDLTALDQELTKIFSMLGLLFSVLIHMYFFDGSLCSMFKFFPDDVTNGVHGERPVSLWNAEDLLSLWSTVYCGELSH